jgi:hypothetical protein
MPLVAYGEYEYGVLDIVHLARRDCSVSVALATKKALASAAE